MTRSNERRATGVTVLCLMLLFSFWYLEAGNISVYNVPGSYTYHSKEDQMTLQLKADHTFLEKVIRGGKVSTAQGTWDLFPSNSQDHIHFSDEFIGVAPRSSPNLQDSRAVYGQVENWFGLLSLILDTSPNSLTFRKTLFS